MAKDLVLTLNIFLNKGPVPDLGHCGFVTGRLHKKENAKLKNMFDI